MLGSVWEYSGVVFGWVREVFEKKFVEKMLILKNVWEYFSQIGVP